LTPSCSATIFLTRSSMLLIVLVNSFVMGQFSSRYAKWFALHLIERAFYSDFLGRVTFFGKK